MSQEKVDKYKKEKANRKKSMQKERIKHVARRFVVGVLGIVLIGWIGYSAYDVYDSSRPKETANIDYGAVTEYQQYLDTLDDAANAQ